MWPFENTDTRTAAEQEVDELNQVRAEIADARHKIARCEDGSNRQLRARLRLIEARLRLLERRRALGMTG